MAVKAKEFRYAIGLDRAGRVIADGRSPLDLDATWTPEHLLLAALGETAFVGASLNPPPRYRWRVNGTAT